MHSFDILFLHVPKFRNWYRPIDRFSFILYHPIGLLGLADYARQNGFSSSIVDLGIEQGKNCAIDYEALISRHGPLLVAITLHWHFQAFDAIETARNLKKAAPETRIVLGGFTASFFADEIMREFPEIDFIIQGDAEVPLVDLVRCIKEKREFTHVPNLIYRSGKAVHCNSHTFTADESLLNRINYTDFSFIERCGEFVNQPNFWVRVHGLSPRLHKALLGSSRMYPVYLGRGCLLNCSFCGGGRHAQRIINNRSGVILRSVENVVKSLIDIHRVGFDGVSFCFDPLPSAETDKFYLELFEDLRTKGIRLFVEFERWKLPSEPFIKAFKETFTSASFVMLSPYHPDESLRKKNNLFVYNNEQLESCLQLFERYQVAVKLCFTMGLPFETEESLKALHAYMKGIEKKYRFIQCKVTLIEIEPCSDLSNNPEHYGISIHKKSFMDYYRYHSNPRGNHFQEMGYSDSGTLNAKKLSMFYCSHFCRIFKAGPLSPVLCFLVGLAWKAGIIRIVDGFLSPSNSKTASTSPN